MNELLNSVRSFLPESPFSTATAGPESDMDIDSIRKAKVPPLRKNFFEYNFVELGSFLKFCSGKVAPNHHEKEEIFKWCMKNNEKNALVWWLEKNQEETLSAYNPNPEEISMMAYVLCRNSSIQRFELSKAHCTIELAKELGNAFKVNKDLKRIFLHDLEFAPDTLPCLAEGLSHQVGTKDFNISGPGLNDQNFACLIQALQNCDRVSLTLSGIRLNSDSAREIFGAIKKSTKIQSLTLSRQKIDKASMSEIASCLQASSGLKQFNFFQNQCEPGTALLLEEALIESSLKSMRFSQIDFDSGPAVSFDRIIKKSRGLSEISLDGKDLNDDDIAKIASELIDHRRMQRFSLENGNFNEESTRALVVALQGNENLYELDLYGCIFRGDAAEDLCASIEKNTVLEKINVWKSNLSDDHKTKINNLCKRNHDAKRFLQQDALLYSRMANHIALPTELGTLLANQMLMLSESTAAYESATIEIALSIQALAANAQNGPQQAAAHSGEALQELPPGCTLV
ncbi:leucine-rich repeat domain-containing protein [Noviherbaspirillum soli]|uniref:hypothetical protein n=1 Tax=Noviherbaspirillum soli TaxID=1064518 RepID=UPI00188D014B|nr:hypothetical protein [Noviherbaspirillum soli]